MNDDGRQLELRIGGATLALATAGYLVASPALAVVALVSGGVAYGMLLGRRG